MTDDLLTIDDLSVRFPGNRHPAVDRISLRIGRGERVGLIGESGSGKSVTALAVMGLAGRQCQDHRIDPLAR